MKCLFVHDHRFYRDNDGKYYSPGKYPYKVWERYLEHFESLTVIGRCKEIPDISNLKVSLSSGDKVEFQTLPNIAGVKNTLKNRNKAKQMIRQAVETSDCIIARLPSLFGFIACQEALKQGKPWAVEVVACAWDGFWNHSLQGKIIAPLMFHNTKHFVAKASHAIYVTREFLQRRYPNRRYAVGCSDVELAATPTSVLEKRLARIAAQEKPLNFGMIGDLSVKYKGHDTALQALALIKDKIPDFRLLCLGDGDQTRIKSIAKELGVTDKVVFSGVLPGGAAVLNWLDQIDIYLMPSQQEGLPRALVEAMSRACPAIGAATGGIPELLPQECIHQAKDYPELARLIEQLVNDLEWRQESARKNFSQAQNFEKEGLDKKRADFWRNFAAYSAEFYKEIKK